MEKWKNRLLENVEGEFNFDYSLRNLSPIGIGGNASLFLTIKKEKYIPVLEEIQSEFNFPLFIIGKGKNTLFRDEGFPGVVLKLDGEFKKIEKRGNEIWAGSGVGLQNLQRFFMLKGFGGIEKLAGIPGSLGGGIAMNAGGKDFSIGEVIKSVKISEKGILKEIKPDFNYRKGVSSGIILKASLKYYKRERREIKRIMKEIMEDRRKKFPLYYPSLGCTFKNPSPEISAGYLIEKAGLKGTKVGGAVVSNKHANFIIKTGECTSGDIIGIIEKIQEKVYKIWKIYLEPEIKIV